MVSPFTCHGVLNFAQCITGPVQSLSGAWPPSACGLWTAGQPPLSTSCRTDPWPAAEKLSQVSPLPVGLLLQPRGDRKLPSILEAKGLASHLDCRWERCLLPRITLWAFVVWPAQRRDGCPTLPWGLVGCARLTLTSTPTIYMSRPLLRDRGGKARQVWEPRKVGKWGPENPSLEGGWR